MTQKRDLRFLPYYRSYRQLSKAQELELDRIKALLEQGELTPQEAYAMAREVRKES